MMMRNNNMKDRRQRERRNNEQESPLLMVDSKGRKKSVDRRRIPDRRLSNIVVEFIPLDTYYSS